jgi:hypothetical protein
VIDTGNRDHAVSGNKTEQLQDELDTLSAGLTPKSLFRYRLIGRTHTPPKPGIRAYTELTARYRTRCSPPLFAGYDGHAVYCGVADLPGTAGPIRA